MKYNIQEYLEKIEAEKNIKILLACETGSRAWGFASPNSDFDVRLIYVHKKDWYISVSEKKDALDLMFENNDLDFSGWELKKSLKLLHKSNASILERIQSPILYRVDHEFLQDIQLLAKQSYSKIATMHHYLSMSNKMMEEVEGKEEYKLKKFFYALRTSVLCKWILDKDIMPPIEFDKAYKNLNLDQQIVKRIDELISLKTTKSEAYLHQGEEIIIHFIRQCLDQANEAKNNLPTGKCKSEDLTAILRKYVNRYDH